MISVQGIMMDDNPYATINCLDIEEDPYTSPYGLVFPLYIDHHTGAYFCIHHHTGVYMYFLKHHHICV